jgi:glyoxylase-like metal-dependent hydrolase (beta-lactamase superfamily II)
MKLYVLDFGRLGIPKGWFFKAQPMEIKPSAMIGYLIEHPKDGLILYEVGPSPDYKKHWPKPVLDMFPILEYKNENRLDVILQKLGHKITDISAVIIGHAHLDHAGGLEFLRGLDIPVYIHKKELEYAFYAVATKEDLGAYLPHYVDPSFNWKVVEEEEVELFDNLTLYHVPGHTPGTMALSVHLKDKNFLLTTDLAIYYDNIGKEIPLGFGLNDFESWYKSIRKMKMIARKYNSKIIPGHDLEVFNSLKHAPEYYE